MNTILIFILLFFAGSVMGWILEFFFRHFASPDRKWMNPGFLTGPYLPIYGFGICTLFTLANFEAYLPFYGTVGNKIILFVLMTLAMTIIEYIAGVIFIHGLKTKLWDYSTERFNFQGIICFKFSLYWGLLGIFYYYVLHPAFSALINWYNANLTFSFIVGIFFGVFFIDVAYSFNLIGKIRSFAAENNILVRYEELKMNIRNTAANQMKKRRFVFAFHPETPIREHLAKYLDFLESKRPHKDK